MAVVRPRRRLLLAAALLLGAGPVALVAKPSRPAAVEDGSLYTFAFSYPPAAARIPALRAHLDARRAAARRELAASARRERKALAGENIPFRPFAYSEDWLTVADLPGWLSLSAVVSTYEGGAHPNHGFDALLWDKAARVRRKPADLFDAAALRGAVRPAFCAELDRQRREKRGGEATGEPGDSFNACLDPLADAVLILGSANRRGFDRLGFLIAPYNAGPYAEGDYEVTLPVTPAVLATVRPPFRAAFALGGNG